MASDYLTLALLVLVLGGLALVWHALRGRAGGEDAGERRLLELAGRLDELGRGLREEQAAGRREAAEAARALREEVAAGFKAQGESQLATLANLAREQQARLEGFSRRLEEGLAALRQNAAEQGRAAREEQTATLSRVSQELTGAVRELNQAQDARLGQVKLELERIQQDNEARQERLRLAVEQRLTELRTDNAAKLEEMRRTVDEKLQGTLRERLGESFDRVARQLEMVHKSVGEMQSLASGVGDLKRVLSNVKSRGTWGEIQLGGILAQLLAPEQYAQNVEIKPGSGQRVEYAIRLPERQDGEGETWLPIDAKFPVEDYERLLAASEQGDPVAEEVAFRALETRIKNSAREIHQKYVSPPHSTDFALMFLPTEGLYAEVLRRPGLVSQLQREQQVVVAGPTTLAALLNSLQMGFKTLAIQKRSSEVWQVLRAVKTEFAKYGEVLDKVKKKLEEASGHIDRVGVRQRAIDRKLKAVEALPEAESLSLLELAPGGEPGED